MNVIKIHPDGRREKILDYGDLTLDLGRKMVRAAASAEVADHGGAAFVTERVVPRGELQVYTAIVHRAQGELIATFEEEWSSPNAEEAKTFFERIQGLDGCGLVTTDDDLLAENIAKLFDVRPEEVSDEYGGEADDRECEHPNAVESDREPPATWYCPDCGTNFITTDDEGVAVAPAGTKMFALCTPQGTACAEAGLCSVCDTPERRAKVEADAVSYNRDNPEYDRPVPGEWHDATGNDAVECQECGKITADLTE